MDTHRSTRRNHAWIGAVAARLGARGAFCAGFTAGAHRTSRGRGPCQEPGEGVRLCFMTTKLSLAAIASLFAGLAAHSATVPLLPSQTHPSGQGFVRAINHSNTGGEVSIRATDDPGITGGPDTLSIGAGSTVQFNSEDLEVGNTGKGLSDGVGPVRATGGWRSLVR